MSTGSIDALTVVLIGLAVPAVFLFARFIGGRVQHGEARFDKDGKIIDDE